VAVILVYYPTASTDTSDCRYDDWASSTDTWVAPADSDEYWTWTGDCYEKNVAESEQQDPPRAIQKWDTVKAMNGWSQIETRRPPIAQRKILRCNRKGIGLRIKVMK
jgi:hypothetical protein